MSSDNTAITPNSLPVRWQNAGAVEFASNNATNDYRIDTVQTHVETENVLGVEVTFLNGAIDTGLVLSTQLPVVVMIGPDGVEAHVPDLDIWESGHNYADAVENVIGYLASDYAFLKNSDRSELSIDAIARLEVYQKFVS